MGSADIILDLISTGVTLRENNLKQIEVGRCLGARLPFVFFVFVLNSRKQIEGGRPLGDCLSIKMSSFCLVFAPSVALLSQ